MGRIIGSNLAVVKKRNTAFIKEVIYKYGPISRSSIAEMLMLTPPTITTNVAELIAAGSVYELGPKAEQKDVPLGRKPVDIDFVCDYAYFIGIEVTPTHRKVGLTDLRANLVASRVLASSTSSYQKVLEELVQLTQEVLEASGVDRKKIMGVGVGVPGFVETRNGMVRSYRRFDWTNLPMAQDVEKQLGLRVLLENNTRARAIGEDLLSKKERPDTFIYFYVSKGVACPLVIRSSIFSGHTTGCGEVGHMVMDLDGPVCDSCGNKGCLESYSSEEALLKACRGIMTSGADTLLNSLVKSPEELTLDDILRAMECQDRLVNATVQRAIRYLAVALANVVNFISPQLVIVDAYVMKLESNRQLFQEIFKQNVFGLNDNEMEMEFKEYDELRGVKGAAACVIRNYFIKEND